MYDRDASHALKTMSDSESDVIVIVTERFERRLAEESGKLRVDMSKEFGKTRIDMATEFGSVRREMADGFGALRVEMIERNHDLLKWMLIFGVSQTAAIVGLIKLWR